MVRQIAFTFMFAAVAFAVSGCANASHDPSMLGLPLYPGVDSKSYRLTEHTGPPMRALRFSASTRDDLAKVLAWYQSRLGFGFQIDSTAPVTTYSKKNLFGLLGTSSILAAPAKDGSGRPIVSITLVRSTPPGAA